MTEVLSRVEAADYLRVSVRQLDRLDLPKSYIGRSPRFFKSDLVAFLEGSKVIPSQIASPACNLVARPVLKRRKGSSGGDWLRSRLAALQ